MQILWIERNNDVIESALHQIQFDISVIKCSTFNEALLQLKNEKNITTIISSFFTNEPDQFKNAFDFFSAIRHLNQKMEFILFTFALAYELKKKPENLSITIIEKDNIYQLKEKLSNMVNLRQNKRGDYINELHQIELIFTLINQEKDHYKIETLRRTYLSIIANWISRLPYFELTEEHIKNLGIKIETTRLVSPSLYNIKDAIIAGTIEFENNNLILADHFGGAIKTVIYDKPHTTITLENYCEEKLNPLLELIKSLSIEYSEKLSHLGSQHDKS